MKMSCDCNVFNLQVIIKHEERKDRMTIYNQLCDNFGNIQYLSITMRYTNYI